jgi:hypothetical protein
MDTLTTTMMIQTMMLSNPARNQEICSLVARSQVWQCRTPIIETEMIPRRLSRIS